MIDTLFPLGMLLGFLSPLAAIGFAVISYSRHRNRIEPERRVPVIGYVLGLIACGCIAGFVGLFWGIALACPQSGNLCGLFEFFVTGPILFSLAIFLVGLSLFLVRPTLGRVDGIG